MKSIYQKIEDISEWFFCSINYAFYFMTLVLRTIPVGVTYAIWSRVGIVLVTTAGIFIYRSTERYRIWR